MRKLIAFFVIIALAVPFTVIHAKAPSAPKPIPIPYTLPSESNVSAAIFDTHGHLIRTLLKDAHQRKGRNSVNWDGRDQYGNPVSPGQYQIRGIWHPPITLQYLLTLDNPGSPPWPTLNGKGDWLSDEAAPQGVATDGENIYLAAPGCEKGSSIIAVGPHGKRLWGYQEEAYPRCVSICCSGNYLYALFSGPLLTDSSNHFNGSNAIGRAFLVCLDKNTGMPAQFSLKSGNTVIATWPYVDHTSGLWDMRVNKSFTPEDYEGQTRYFANNVGEPTNGVGIAESDGKLYVSMLQDNRILVLNAENGSRLATIPVPSPVGLRALSTGKLLVVSDGKVRLLNPANGSLSTVIDSHLDAPYDVTTDTLGDIYVSDWGKSFQVKVFSPQGKYLRAIGRPGGRPWIGGWDKEGMLLPRGIAVTNAGELWVAEDDASPNRVSVWNAGTGAFLRDYLGPAPYGGGANFWVDPKDIHTVLAAETLWKVDYARKSAYPVSTPFRRLSEREPFTPTGMFGVGEGSRTLIHNGVEYVYVNTGAYSMLVFRREGLRLTPVMAMGCLGRYITTDGTTAEIWDSDIGSHFISNYYPSFFKGHEGDNYLWIDRNGDGKVEPNEMQWVRTTPRSDSFQPGHQLEACTGWGMGFGPNGGIYFSGFCRDRNVVYRLNRTGWSAKGAPSYTLADAIPVIISTAGVQSLYVGNDHHLYVSRPYEYNQGKDALDCYNRDDKLLWSMQRPTGIQQAKDVLSDRVMYEFTEPDVGPIIATWLWHGNYKPYLLTSDGIYIASLLEDTHLGPYANWDESYLQAFQSSNGAAYLVNGGNDAYHFLRIDGLNRMHRFQYVMRITSKQIRDAARSPARSAGRNYLAPQKPVICIPFLSKPPTLNGELTGWDMSDAVHLVGSKRRSAHVALFRDAKNLYLAYQVHGSRMVNKGGNVNTLFISGDCCDLMLSNSSSPPHYTAQAGDERVLFSLFREKPLVALYQPVVRGKSNPVRLMGAIIDRITVLNSAKVVFHRTRNGYIMEASVPFSAIGVKSTSSEQSLKGDVGVIFADETGANRALRLYYYNQHTSITSDLTTEATLQPGEWGDILFPQRGNLLKNSGFERPLTNTAGGGWIIGSQRFGSATVTSITSYCGSHSLCLQETSPVVFPPQSYSDQDYGRFIQSANGGAGGCFVQITQQFPVTGGRSYDFRFRYRATDMQHEIKNPGHPRGYDSLGIWLNWTDANGKQLGNIWVCNIQHNQPLWEEMVDTRAGYTLLNTPYPAPNGAAHASLSIQLVGNAEGRMPRVYLDGLEFTENNPPGQLAP